VLERIAFYGSTDGYKKLRMVLNISLSFDKRDDGLWGWCLLWSTWFTKPREPGVTTTTLTLITNQSLKLPVTLTHTILSLYIIFTASYHPHHTYGTYGQ